MNHEITLDEAIDLTKRFRTLRPTVLNPLYEAIDILPTCETFDREAVQALLNANPDCASFRIYYGMTDDLKVHAVLVAADANGADLLPAPGNENVILEGSQRCPNTCPPASSLNS
ncbi:hypothetical protein [Flaviaesturariibacter amylovorans]|uniref:Uncharacterized protein n=1 Tax=Flaviaesturariibacter amylovorans TaxID=1084520 RepID=A0ABP8HDF2_9BACT